MGSLVLKIDHVIKKLRFLFHLDLLKNMIFRNSDPGDDDEDEGSGGTGYRNK